jgi:hypothetical protein
MDTNVKLSENLILTAICENNEQDGELIAVECYFNFFGKEGEAYVVIENLDDEYPRYAMTEICSELSDSFNDLLEVLPIGKYTKSISKCVSFSETIVLKLIII